MHRLQFRSSRFCHSVVAVEQWDLQVHRHRENLLLFVDELQKMQQQFHWRPLRCCRGRVSIRGYHTRWRWGESALALRDEENTFVGEPLADVGHTDKKRKKAKRNASSFLVPEPAAPRRLPKGSVLPTSTTQHVRLHRDDAIALVSTLLDSGAMGQQLFFKTPESLFERVQFACCADDRVRCELNRDTKRANSETHSMLRHDVCSTDSMLNGDGLGGHAKYQCSSPWRYFGDY